MTEVQNKILAYLIDNVNTDNEITISNAELAKQCDVNLKTIQKFQKEAVSDGILSFEKGKYIINENVNVDYTYQISKYVKENDLNLSTNEKKVLGYIAKLCSAFSESDSTYISYNNITENCKLSIPTVTKIVRKLIDNGFIACEQGNYKEKRANKYKVLFPTKQIETQTINQSDKSTAFSQCENVTINNYINELEIKELKELVISQSNQISDLKDCIINLYNRFNVVEKVADILLKYIDEVEHDLDNVYMINNIQRPKPQCKCSILNIRKILDENKQ